MADWVTEVGGKKVASDLRNEIEYLVVVGCYLLFISQFSSAEWRSRQEYSKTPVPCDNHSTLRFLLQRRYQSRARDGQRMIVALMIMLMMMRRWRKIRFFLGGRSVEWDESMTTTGMNGNGIREAGKREQNNCMRDNWDNILKTILWKKIFVEIRTDHNF